MKKGVEISSGVDIVVDLRFAEDAEEVVKKANKRIEKAQEKTGVRSIKIIGEMDDELWDELIIPPSVVTLDMSNYSFDEDYDSLLSKIVTTHSITTLELLNNHHVSLKRIEGATKDSISSVKIEGEMDKELQLFLATIPRFVSNSATDLDLSDCKNATEYLDILARYLAQLDALERLHLKKGQVIAINGYDSVVTITGGSINRDEAEKLAKIVTSFKVKTIDLSDCTIDENARNFFGEKGITIKSPANVKLKQSPKPATEEELPTQLRSIIEQYHKDHGEDLDKIVDNTEEIEKILQEINTAITSRFRIGVKTTEPEKKMQAILIMYEADKILSNNKLKTEEKLSKIQNLHSIIDRDISSDQDHQFLQELLGNIIDGLAEQLPSHPKSTKALIGQPRNIQLTPATAEDLMLFGTGITIDNKAKDKFITPEFAKELVKEITDKKTTINLQGCQIDDEAMKILIKAIKNSKSISTLTLSDKQTITFERNNGKITGLTSSSKGRSVSSEEGIEHAKQLTNIIGQLNDITTINLRSAGIGDTGLEILAPTLKKHPSIQYIDLFNNKISDINLAKDIVDSNQNIAFINLDGNSLGNFPKQTQELHQIFKRRREQLLQENLLDAAADLAICAGCSHDRNGRKYNDELFNLIRKYFKKNPTISIGIESSQTKGSVEELINEQQQKIRDQLSSNQSISLEENKLKRQAQIIAILRTIADILSDDQKQENLEKLRSLIDLNGNNTDQKFLAQLLEKAIKKLGEKKTIEPTSKQEISDYTRDQMDNDPSTAPLYKRFKLGFLERRLDSAEKQLLSRKHSDYDLDDLSGAELEKSLPSIYKTNTSPSTDSPNKTSTINPIKKLQAAFVKWRMKRDRAKYQPEEESSETTISINPLFQKQQGLKAGFALNPFNADQEEGVTVNPLAFMTKKEEFKKQVEAFVSLLKKLDSNESEYGDLRGQIMSLFFFERPQDLAEQFEKKLKEPGFQYSLFLKYSSDIKDILEYIKQHLPKGSETEIGLIDKFFEMAEKTPLDQITEGRDEMSDIVSELLSTQARLRRPINLKIPEINGQKIDELLKATQKTERASLLEGLPKSLPVEFYLDDGESKLYEQINKVSAASWRSNKRREGSDGNLHSDLVSYTATIDQNNRVKYRTIVTNSSGTFVQFPNQKQMMQKDEEVQKCKKNDKATNSLEDAVYTVCMKEITKIKTTNNLNLFQSVINENHQKMAGSKPDFESMMSNLPLSTTRDSGFCIFRPKDQNVAHVIFNLSDNCSPDEIDNVVYLNINGSDKFLRIRVGIYDDEKITVDGKVKTLQKGETFIYPEVYSKACDPKSIVPQDKLSENDKKAIANFNVLAVALTDSKTKSKTSKKLSSSLKLGDIIDNNAKPQEIMVEKAGQVHTNRAPTMLS